MGVLCLFVQEQRSRLNLFLHSSDELLLHQSLLISKQFGKYIQKVTDVRGDVVLLNRFRSVFVLLNEIYVVAVCSVNDYPFDALRCINHAKRILFETCKGVEVSVGAVYRKYGQVMLALEELLHESNTFKEPTKELDIVSKSKLSDTGPMHSMANRPAAITTASMAMGKKGTSGGSMIGGVMTSSARKHNDAMMMSMTEMSNINTEWSENRKQASVHQKRFEILEKFCFETSELDTSASDNELFLSQFGQDFSAPTDEPLPHYHRTRSQTQLDHQRDNGLSSARLKQLSSLTKNNLEMLDDTFGTLVTPTFQPILASNNNIRNNANNNMNIVNNGGLSMFDQPPSHAIKKENERKKLDSNFSLLQVDTDSHDNSESSDTFTNTSVYTSGTNGRNSLSSSSMMDSPANYTSRNNNNNSFGISLDDLLSGFDASATDSSSILQPTPLSNLPPKPVQNPVFSDLDDLLGKPTPPVTSTNVDLNKNNNRTLPSFTPPQPPQLNANLTFAPPRTQPKTQQEPRKRPQPANTNQPPVVMQGFDPSQILKKFEERAQVIYLTAAVKEKIEVVYTGSNRTKYQLVGEVMVKPFSSDHTHGMNQHDFVLSLSKTEKIASIRCNPKYCRQINDEYNFNCSVGAQEISKGPVVLLRYKIQENMCPMPIVFQPKFRVQDAVMTLLIKYKVNPDTPLKNLSVLVQPVTKEHLSDDLNVLAAQSKPEGRWTQQQQKLLWRLQDVKFNPEQKQGETLVAKFKMNRNPLDYAQYAPGPVLIKLNSESHVFSGVYVEGGDSKRNAVTNQVFVGGCEYGVEITEFQLVLTPEQYLAQ